MSLEDQDRWHDISEGSEMLPLSFLEALKCPRTGRSFLESLAECGFLVESQDPHQLPVGWTTEWRAVKPQKVPFVGINCAACHSGELRYGRNTLRIDGAPNLFSLEQFFVDLRGALTALRNSPLEAFLFVRNVIHSHHDPKKAGEFLEVSPEALSLLHSVDTADGLDAEEAHLSEFVGAAFGKIIDERTAATNLEFSYAGFAGGATDAKRQSAVAPPAGQSSRASRAREIISALRTNTSWNVAWRLFATGRRHRCRHRSG